MVPRVQYETATKEVEDMSTRLLEKDRIISELHNLQAREIVMSNLIDLCAKQCQALEQSIVPCRDKKLISIKQLDQLAG